MANTVTSRVDRPAPFAEIAEYLDGLIHNYNQGKRFHRFVQRLAAEEMKIDSTSLSKYIHGRGRPTPSHCLALARFFGRPLEEVLRAAGYPDLRELYELVKTDESIEDRELKKRALDILAMAQASPLWRDLPSGNPYKDRAERDLASDKEPFQKALDYTDMVYFWYKSRDRDTLRWQRKTDELPKIS